jgi:hypothetical protein
MSDQVTYEYLKGSRRERFLKIRVGLSNDSVSISLSGWHDRSGSETPSAVWIHGYEGHT